MVLNGLVSSGAVAAAGHVNALTAVDIVPPLRAVRQIALEALHHCGALPSSQAMWGSISGEGRSVG